MEEQNVHEALTGKDKHYSDDKFLTKMKGFGGKLGAQAFQAATTLFIALKSPDMPNSSKLIVLGALGYFILPLDMIADFLPLVGLTDDTMIIMAALGKVYLSITDEMKEEAALLTEKWTGQPSSFEE